MKNLWPLRTFQGPSAVGLCKKPKDKNYIGIREAPGKGARVSRGYTFTVVLRLPGASLDATSPSVRLAASALALPAEATAARARGRW